MNTDVCTIMEMSLCFLLVKRNVSDKSRAENQNTHLILKCVSKKVPFMKDNVKNMVLFESSLMTI